MANTTLIGRDLPPIIRDGRDYFLLSHQGALYLVHNLCPHRGGPLKFGYVTCDAAIVCPMHGNAYSAERLIARPTTLRLRPEEIPAHDEILACEEIPA